MDVLTKPIVLPLLLALCACQPQAANSTDLPASVSASAPLADAADASRWGQLADESRQQGQTFEVYVSVFDMKAHIERELPLGRIDADGLLQVFDPQARFRTNDDGNPFGPDTCERGSLHNSEPALRAQPLSLRAKRVSDGRRYQLVAYTSPEAAKRMQAPNHPGFEAEQGMIRLYEASHAASVQGRCDYVDEYGLQNTVRHALSLQPGLNLVQDMIHGKNADGDTDYSLTSLSAFPALARWYLLDPDPPSFGGATVWGQLDGDGVEGTALQIHAVQRLEGDEHHTLGLLGNTGPDGYLHLSDAPLPKDINRHTQPVQVFFCETARIDNPDARLLKAELIASNSDGRQWRVVGASRRELALMQAGVAGGHYGLADTMLHVYYASAPVQISGDCGDENISLHFSPGRNVVRAVVQVVDQRPGHEDGPWPTRWLLESIGEPPPDTRWYMIGDDADGAP